MKGYYASTIITDKGIINDSYLLVDKGKVVGIDKKPANVMEVISFDEGIIAPGYIDIHTHGGLGYEPGLNSIDCLIKWANFKSSHGVTGFLVSTPTIPFEELKIAVKDTRECMKKLNFNLLGLHMEGPFFIAGGKIGAQNPKNIIDFFPDYYKKLIKDNNDVIRYLALDPLHKNVKEIVACCQRYGIKVSAAHSEVLHYNFKKIKDDFSSITHTFNGMIGLHHRKPGLAYTAVMDKDIYAEIICDGYHVSYPMLKLFFDLKNFDKIILITDSMSAVGLPPGPLYKFRGP